jgi:hypothetical protein
VGESDRKEGDRWEEGRKRMAIYDDDDAGRRRLLLVSDSDEGAVGEETMDLCVSTYHAAAPRKSREAPFRLGPLRSPGTYHYSSR